MYRRAARDGDGTRYRMGPTVMVQLQEARSAKTTVHHVGGGVCFFPKVVCRFYEIVKFHVTICVILCYIKVNFTIAP